MPQPDLERMDVSVIIVSYNTAAHLDACLASIAAATTCQLALACSHEVIVVDNASTDDSAAQVRTQHPAARLLVNPRNLGFAAANNQGARLARGRYLLLLNPDTRMTPGAMAQLVTFMDAHPEVGICAPQNRNGADHPLFGAAGAVQVNAFHFPRFQGLTGIWRSLLRRLGAPLAPRPEPPPFIEGDGYILADWLRGCSLCVRADLYRRLGGMDEGFFLYLEDTDLCRRVRWAGYACAVVSAAEILHFGGVSYADDPNPRIKTMLGKEFLRAKYHYVRRARGRRAAGGVRLADLLAGIRILVGGSREGGEQGTQRAWGWLLVTEALLPAVLAHAERRWRERARQQQHVS